MNENTRRTTTTMTTKKKVVKKRTSSSNLSGDKTKLATSGSSSNKKLTYKSSLGTNNHSRPSKDDWKRLEKNLDKKRNMDLDFYNSRYHVSNKFVNTGTGKGSKNHEITSYERNLIDRLPRRSAIYCHSINFQYKGSDYLSLDKFTMNVNDGEFHGLIGNNGAGKSTIIKIICGLNEEYEGYLFINKDNPKRIQTLRRDFSYIPDKPIFPKYISCKKYLLNSALVLRNDKTTIINEIDKWAKNMDISNIMNKNPNHLSAGQKKKIQILKAIIERSKILILDEPAANLDVESRRKLFEILKFMNKNMGITILISSHILDEIKKYIDSASIIKSGKCQYSGPVNDKTLLSIYQKYK